MTPQAQMVFPRSSSPPSTTEIARHQLTPRNPGPPCRLGACRMAVVYTGMALARLGEHHSMQRSALLGLQEEKKRPGARPGQSFEGGKNGLLDYFDGLTTWSSQVIVIEFPLTSVAVTFHSMLFLTPPES